MSYPVIKGAGYVLIYTPDMILHNGTTQTLEKATNPDSEYLKAVPNNIRSFEEVVSYPPNQTYIGGITPQEMKSKFETPYVGKSVDGAERFAKYGEIMPQDEFIGLMKASDAFDLVILEESFAKDVKAKLEAHPLITEEILSRLDDGQEISVINKAIQESEAETLYHDNKVVGCVKRAHAIDVNLNAHVIFENLVVKASGILSMLNMLAKNNLDPAEIDYVIECSEEACGDMNQRGGGNFAKAIAELTGCLNATGSDTRGFCAAPTHALIEAAAFVKSGVFKNVAIVAGGASAKLGMNGKDHIKKGFPILEDVVGGFATLIGENDGVNPTLRTDLVGKHTVATGSSPQAVMTSLITNALDKGNLKINDIDRYSVEMQNPDITVPAGAGNVPEANYKMIAALGVQRGELERADVATFADTHGLPGWAPTQGHIPSGVPYLSFCREEMLEGNIEKAMVVGKGSLFLGRMTNLFDGVSIVIEKNDGKVTGGQEVSEEEVKKLVAEAMRDFASHLLGN